MPVYLLTFHSYLSWLPDRPEGYVEKGKGIQPQDLDRAREYFEAAAHDPIVFDAQLGWAMIDEAALLCQREKWQLYEAAVTSTHVHLLVGWRTALRWRRVAARFKQRLGRALSISARRPGPWFSRGGSRKRVRERSHFDHLLRTYLPRHGSIRYRLRYGDDA